MSNFADKPTDLTDIAQVQGLTLMVMNSTIGRVFGSRYNNNNLYIVGDYPVTNTPTFKAIVYYTV